MTMTVTTAEPTATVTGLTAGGKYSIFHSGPLNAQVKINDEWTTVYTSKTSASTLMLGIPGTEIRIVQLSASELSSSGLPTTTHAEITELA